MEGTDWFKNREREMRNRKRDWMSAIDDFFKRHEYFIHKSPISMLRNITTIYI